MEIIRHQLANGLRVNLQPDPALPLVAINLWYHVGSKNERPGKTGLAHLFEHMLFEGSAHVGPNEHFRHLQQVGGVANGSTSRDRTNYYEVVPAHCLELGLWLESDRMGFLLPALTEEKLENQRQVVINERAQRTDNQPYGRSGERLFELLYPGDHPYHWPIIGYREDLATVTLQDLRTFFRTYYSPANAVLTLAGGFAPDAALTQVERYFGDLPDGAPPPPPLAATEELAGEVREVVVEDVGFPRVQIAYRGPAYGCDAWYAGDLLAAVLADGKSSPLYQDLAYRRELVQNVSAYVYDHELPGSFHATATAKAGVRADDLVAALDAHLERAREEPPAASDLERALNRVETMIDRAFERLDQRADLISQQTVLFDDPHRLTSELERYRRLTAEDLLDFARRYLDPARRVVLTTVPRTRPA